MAKRELSSTLRNLKFMQRAAKREEKIEKEVEVIPDGNFSSSCAVKKCIVIVEGDPHPGVTKGRMSFQRFNPSIDKLNEENNGIGQPEASTTSSGNQNLKVSDNGECESSHDGFENLKLDSSNDTANGDRKRKQPQVASTTPSPYESRKNVQGGQEARKESRNPHQKQPKREKLDWAVLRPPKGQNKSR